MSISWPEARPFLWRPLLAVRYAFARFVLPSLLSMMPGLRVAGRLHLRGFPSILIMRHAEIVLDDDVKLNSLNEGYHLNMHSPVKLMASRPSAFIYIGARTRIHGSCIHAQSRIVIGHDCLIAANSQIFDCNGHDVAFDDPSRRAESVGTPRDILIGDFVWIGANCLILPGVTIGDGSVIAAGSVVRDDVPPNTVVSGNPAIPMRRVEKPLEIHQAQAL